MLQIQDHDRQIQNHVRVRVQRNLVQLQDRVRVHIRIHFLLNVMVKFNDDNIFVLYTDGLKYVLPLCNSNLQEIIFSEYFRRA